MLRWIKNKPAAPAMVIVLCICVTLQMLGVPATLLNPSGEFDTGGSVLEGFTLLPAPVHLQVSPQASSRADQCEASAHDAVMTAVPFHPPISA